MRTLSKIFRKLYRTCRIIKYSLLSDSKIKIKGKVKQLQPILYRGTGEVVYDNRVKIGYDPSPNFYDTIAYFECRKKIAVIKIGNDVVINNGVAIIADKDSISIGDNTLIGHNVSMFTSDFHVIDPVLRLKHSKAYEHGPINIGSNVWIGSEVMILKNVNIGDNCVIGAGAVVINDIPNNTIAAGNPAKVLKSI